MQRQRPPAKKTTEASHEREACLAGAQLRTRGVSRREFIGFCATMAAALALPDAAAAQIARAIQKTDKPILVWLEFQDCAGNTEGFLRASRPTAAEVVLDVLSLDYHETIMAAAGHQAEANLARTVKEQSRRLHRHRRGVDSHRRQRRLLHHRRPRRDRHRARGLRQRRRDHRHRHLRRVRRHSGGGAEPHRRARASPTPCLASGT